MTLERRARRALPCDARPTLASAGIRFRMTTPLKTSLHALADYSRVRQYREHHIAESDIALSTASGMDARDVAFLRELTAARALCIIVRCPKPDGRVLQGVLPPKPMAVKEKSKEFGVVGRGTPGQGDVQTWVSDYDLMGLWKYEGGRHRPLPLRNLTGALADHSTLEARAVAALMNARLVSPIQHGCQDDFLDRRNPGVSDKDHFAIYLRGRAQHLRGVAACAAFYRAHGLAWHYGPSGRYPWPPLPARPRT
jgi:hypothetical protein